MTGNGGAMHSAGWQREKIIRYTLIAAFLLTASIWSMAQAQQQIKTQSYPEHQFLVTGKWLLDHHDDDKLVIVDVRSEKLIQKEGGKYIPDAINLPWGSFRIHNSAYGIADTFVGLETAQKILGNVGISRNSTVVLYDSVNDDGGATASYLFWVLDMLGHENIHLLERGIESWTEAGGSVTVGPRLAKPVLYQARADQIRVNRLTDEHFIYNRLGDKQYLILDVRSREEYLGEKPNIGLTGNVLKLGHIPTAVNIDYRLNWLDSKSKIIKDYRDLQQLYRGFDPNRPVIVYCHSGRRSSFTYFILRLMGFQKVTLYDNSWNGWGSHSAFFPAETRENRVSGTFIPATGIIGKNSQLNRQQTKLFQRDTRLLKEPKGGYVSCGG